jgi:predicted HAD superfamily Cof-like phosphohydrolase
MMKIQNREDLVEQFHSKFKHPINEQWTSTLLELRLKLIREESGEVMEEFVNIILDLERGKSISLQAKERVLKEMCDLQYVLSGTAVALGLDIQTAFNRVHESNMSKLGIDGKPVYRDDGKVIKSVNYKPPELEDLVK